MKRQYARRLFSCLVLCALLTGLLPARAEAAPAQFRDVPASHPAAESIRRCVELGFFQGESSSVFGLGKPMTRGNFAVVLNRFFGWEPVIPPRFSPPTFKDVPSTSRYYTAVETAAAMGAITAQLDAFRPDDPITREETAEILIRTLGYSELAGMVQELPIPYRDVHTNLGYITVAYDFSLIDGTGHSTFSPRQAASREELAVILMRLYDKLEAPASWNQGMASSPEELPDPAEAAVTTIPALRLIFTGQPTLVNMMESSAAASLRGEVQSAGGQALLCVTGGPTSLNGGAAETAKVLADAVTQGGYDGLYLDIGELKSTQELPMTRLAAALAPALGDKLFYLAANAPSWHGETPDGYDYAALGASADKLVLRLPAYAAEENGLVVAPPEPLEEIYFALGQLRDTVDWDKLSILLTTTPTLYIDGKPSGEISRAELEELLKEETAVSYYSERYACRYAAAVLEDKGVQHNAVVWYLDAQGIQARARLAALFGVDQLFMESWAHMPPMAEEAGETPA